MARFIRGNGAGLFMSGETMNRMMRHKFEPINDTNTTFDGACRQCYMDEDYEAHIKEERHIVECTFIEASPEEADIARRVKYVEDDEGRHVVEYKPDAMGRWPLTTPFVESDLVCMHCATKLTQKSITTGLLVQHPTPQGFVGIEGAICIIRREWSAEAGIKEIGKMVRWVHEKLDEDAAKAAQVDERHDKLFILEAPKAPAYTEHHPHEHLTKVLQPLLNPHLEALASAIHITEAIGPMQQWTFDMDDECGFKGRIIIQLDEVGDCIYESDVRRKSGSDDTTGPESNDPGESEDGGPVVRPVKPDRDGGTNDEGMAPTSTEGYASMGGAESDVATTE